MFQKYIILKFGTTLVRSGQVRLDFRTFLIIIAFPELFSGRKCQKISILIGIFPKVTKNLKSLKKVIRNWQFFIFI